MRSRTSCVLLCCFAIASHISSLLDAAERNDVFDYTSTISSDANGPLDLKAGVIWDDSITNAPIAVVMHSYSSNTTFSNFFPNADRLRDQGFMAILVAMRQRDGSDGVRDSGGLEIYDIFDAVEAVKADPAYAGAFNPDITYITGYSGGGGNTMSALTKFPDYWNAGAAFVGMSDYGFDPVDSWYFDGAGSRTSILNADIGDRTTNDPAIIDEYHARASNLASKNNPYAETYLFSNEAETISPIWNDITYRDNAVAAESFPGEFDNIRFINGRSGVEYEGPGQPADWVDWNNNGTQESFELQNYPHSSSLTVQERGEAWFLDDLKAGNLPHPVLNDADELFVAGWVRTNPFQLFLGDGQNAAGDLSYSMSASEMIFELGIASNDKSVTGELSIYQNRLATPQAVVELNGTQIGLVDLSGGYVYSGLADGDTLRLIAIPEPTASCILYSGGLLTVLCSRKACSHRRVCGPPCAARNRSRGR